MTVSEGTLQSPLRCGLPAQLHRESASALGTPRAVPGTTPIWQAARPAPPSRGASQNHGTGSGRLLCP